MIEVKYISSNGKEYDLHGDIIRVTSGNFHKYEWNVLSHKSNYGQVVDGFERNSLKYKIVLTVRGSADERKKIINDLIESAEYDIVHKTPGTFWHGRYYIKGYIISSESGPSSIRPWWSQDSIEIFCIYPFWILEKSYRLEKTDIESKENKRYGGRYKYRYASGQKERYIVNEHFSDCHFLIRMYGPCVNPSVTIEGIEHSVNVILQSGEYVEINSRTEKVEKVLSDGKRENLFHFRNKDVFQRIPAGRVSVAWDNKFNLDIVLYGERSEPKWE